MLAEETVFASDGTGEVQAIVWFGGGRGEEIGLGMGLIRKCYIHSCFTVVGATLWFTPDLILDQDSSKPVAVPFSSFHRNNLRSSNSAVPGIQSPQPCFFHPAAVNSIFICHETQ